MSLETYREKQISTIKTKMKLLLKKTKENNFEVLTIKLLLNSQNNFH